MLRPLLPQVVLALLFLTPILLIPAIPLMAQDTSLTYIPEKSKSMSNTFGTREQKALEESVAKSSRDARAKGLDRNTQDALRQMEQEQTTRGLDVSLTPQTLFLVRLRQTEQHREPFATCRVLTLPKLPRDFGLSPEKEDGWTDNVKASWLSQVASAGRPMAEVAGADEPGVRAYRDCVALYGVTIAQATLLLVEDLKALPIEIQGDPRESATIRGIGYDDVQVLADAAVDRAAGPGGITDGFLKRLLASVLDDPVACTFDGSLQNVRCGASKLGLSSAPTLTVGNVEVYGSSFAGLTASLKVSRTMSYSRAIEQLRGTSLWTKQMQEAAETADKRVSEGRSREATSIRQRTVSAALRGQIQAAPDELRQPKSGGGLQQKR
jgi:hypothetical protein